MADTDIRLAEIADRLQAATTGTWGTHFDGAIYHLAADMRITRTGTSPGRPIGSIPVGDDGLQAFHNAMFIGRARDDVAFLLGLLAERDVQIAYLLAAEPTLDDDQPGAPE